MGQRMNPTHFLPTINTVNNNNKKLLCYFPTKTKVSIKILNCILERSVRQEKEICCKWHYTSQVFVRSTSLVFEKAYF